MHRVAMHSIRMSITDTDYHWSTPYLFAHQPRDVSSTQNIAKDQMESLEMLTLGVHHSTHYANHNYCENYFYQLESSLIC